MKKVLKFLEENSKWVVIFLVGIGIIFIIKLWWFGMDTYSSCGGGAINLCLGWNFDYYWINASNIASLFTAVVLFLIIFISDSKNGITKIKIAFIVLLLGLLGKPLFYLISPDFKFYDFGEYRYTNKNGKLTNIDLYLEGMKKYCDNSIDDFKFKRVYREDMCAGQYVIDLNTVEEYAKVFDFANKNNLSRLYRLTYNGAKDFGIEKIIEGYNDDTFYGYVIDWYWENKIILDKIKQNTNNIKIKDLIEFIDKKTLEGDKLENEFKNGEFSEYWDEFNNDLKQKLKEIPDINYNIF